MGPRGRLASESTSLTSAPAAVMAVRSVFPSALSGVMARTTFGAPVGSGWFKIPTVWGAKETAPYFHDNSAKTLVDMMNHYDDAIFVLSETDPTPVTLGQVDLTEQNKADIIAYMNLL